MRGGWEQERTGIVWEDGGDVRVEEGSEFDVVGSMGSK